MAEKPFENPLPADLPENWTAGQIVAPTGEEVGLSHQHGYNYLMEMVNRAHLHINIVNDAVADLLIKLSIWENWYETDLPASGEWISIAYGNGKFVAISQDYPAHAAYSLDGINWAVSYLPDVNSWDQWQRITYGNGKFVAVRYGQSCAYSEDGLTWSEADMPSSDSDSVFWKSVTYGNGKFIAVAAGKTFAHSKDGVTWERTNPVPGYSWNDVTYGNSKFVAVCRDHYATTYSTDGVSWEQGGYLFGSSASWHIAFGNGKFVAVGGPDGNYSYSEDGIHWINAMLPNQAIANDIIFGNGNFVAVLENSNKCLYSEDGVNWSIAPLPTSARWSSGAFGAGRFALVAGNGSNKVVYSGSAGGGCPGPAGKDGEGVPAGGAAGQILSKKTAADYDTQWVNPPECGSGGGVAGVSSFKGRTGAVQPASGDYTAEMVGARPDDWMPSAADVGAVPAATISGFHVLTQAEYDALSTKDEKVLYLIKE